MGPNDPHLTAYALGELSGLEKEKVEVWLKTHPEGKKWIEDIKKAAGILQAELKTPSPYNLGAQRVEK